MSKTLLKNARVVLENEIRENSCVLIEDGFITEISDEDKEIENCINLQGNLLLPGFTDIHNHGAVGFDVNAASTDELVEIAKFLASQGVTSWLPTLVPDSDANYQRAIDSINGLIEIQEDMPVAQALGVHYEGVFANEKMCGALRSEYFKSFKNGDEVSKLPRLKSGVHFTTLAPEIENGIELIKELRRQNWIVSIGHTKAETDILDAAFESGAEHLTHFFNAMTGLHHRNLGVVGWALMKDDVTFDIIADGVHVHPEILEFAVRNKSVDQVSLISDSISPTGLGDGDYDVWNEKISVVEGKTNNEKGSIAGSVITMLDAVKLMLEIGFTEVQVAKMSALNPAKLLGTQKTNGSIKLGKRADLVVIDSDGKIVNGFIGGKVV